MTFVPDDELLAELNATFAAEAAEYIASLNENLLVLERSESEEERQQLLREIFRHAHSLKGGAAVVGLEGIRILSHHLESIFGGLQRGEVSFTPAMFDLLYRALDLIQRFLQEGGENGEALMREADAVGAQLQTVLGEDPVTGGASMDSPSGAIRTAGLLSETPPEPERLEPAPQGDGDDPQPKQRPSPRGGGDTVRIATSKLDDLMNQVGEVVVAAGGLQRTTAEVAVLERELAELVRKGRGGTAAVDEVLRTLAAALERVEGLRAWITADGRRMNQVTDQLQASVRRARMLPVSSVFDAFPRMVRDLAHSQNKEMRLEIRGGDTNLDRTVLEQIKSPLTHLLRNCIDHGLEDPEMRIAAGKEREGTVVLAARQQGDSVLIEVSDDGAGIDVEKVRAAAVEKGGIRSEDADAMETGEALSLIFRSGLSTSGFITSISGRGVGLDVVRENVEGLHGTITVDTSPGLGTTFSLILPLTVATTTCVLVRCGGQIFAVPLTHVLRTTRISADDIGEAEGKPAIPLAEGPLPLRELASVLGLEASTWSDDLRPVLIARCGEGTVALLVDEVLGVEEVIVKNLPPPLMRVRHTAGGSILGGGGGIVVLNVADVVRTAVRSEGTGGIAERRTAGNQGPERQKILIADDSITTRTLEKNILQSAGYDVRVAVDGAAAWRAIQEDPPDLVVSDVEMPGLTGFELTVMIREYDHLKYLPVVLVTSLESDADRERGIDVGADAYIGKSSFDQEQLIDVIRRLI